MNKYYCIIYFNHDDCEVGDKTLAECLFRVANDSLIHSIDVYVDEESILELNKDGHFNVKGV